MRTETAINSTSLEFMLFNLLNCIFELIFLSLHLLAMRAEIFRRRVRTAQMVAARQPAASVGRAVVAQG